MTATEVAEKSDTMLNTISMQGNLVKDASVKLFANGSGVMNFSICNHDDYKDAKVTFVDCSFFNTNDKLAAMLTKGKPIIVTGRLEVNNTSKVIEGKTFYQRYVNIIVEKLSFINTGKKQVATGPTEAVNPVVTGVPVATV